MLLARTSLTQKALEGCQIARLSFDAYINALDMPLSFILSNDTKRRQKQDYKWESMRLMTYEGLKNMNMIFWISISFLYACKEYILLWADAFPREFGQYRKKLIKLFDFVYPALMKVVKIIFENWSKYDYGSVNNEPSQLWVSFF